MTRLFLAAVATWLAATASAPAATFKLPNYKPVVAVTIPPLWKPVAIEKGVQAQSSDDAVYLAAELTNSEKDMNAIIDETFNMLKEHKFTLKGGTKTERKYDLNGLAADEMTYQGKDEDGPTTVKVTFIRIGKDYVLVLTYWAAPDGEKKFAGEIRDIFQSVRATK